MQVHACLEFIDNNPNTPQARVYIKPELLIASCSPPDIQKHHGTERYAERVILCQSMADIEQKSTPPVLSCTGHCTQPLELPLEARAITYSSRMARRYSTRLEELQFRVWGMATRRSRRPSWTSLIRSHTATQRSLARRPQKSWPDC